jgi:YVTN family beta-propeller protein
MRIFLALLIPNWIFAVAGFAESRLLVVHKWADSLGVYSSETGEKLASIPVGRIPHELVLNPDRTLAYVTEYGVRSYTDESKGGNTIAIVDLTTLRQIGAIDLGRYHRPHGILMGDSGKLYVTVDFPPALLVVDPEKKLVASSFELDQSLPHMVSVLSDESRAYTANTGSGTVSVIDLSRGQVISDISIGGAPMGFSLTGDDRVLFASNRTGEGIAVIDTAQNRVTKMIRVEGQPARLLLINNDGLLLASLHEAGDVAVIDTTTFEVVERFDAGAAVEGMNADESAGFGYVSAQGDDKVVKFSLKNWQVLMYIETEARPDPIQLLP